MFEIIGKGFAAAKREYATVQLKAVAHERRRGSTCGLFAISLSVDIAQLKSTSVVTRGHDRLRRKGSQSDIGKPKGFSNVSETWPLISSACPTAPLSLHPLWTLRINRVSRVYFRFRIQSYVALLIARRITKLTRNPSFRFNIVCNVISIRICISISHLQKLYFTFTNILFYI